MHQMKLWMSLTMWLWPGEPTLDTILLHSPGFSTLWLVPVLTCIVLQPLCSLPPWSILPCFLSKPLPFTATSTPTQIIQTHSCEFIKVILFSSLSKILFCDACIPVITCCSKSLGSIKFLKSKSYCYFYCCESWFSIQCCDPNLVPYLFCPVSTSI